MKPELLEDTAPTRCYRHRGILYVPHYNLPGEYVQPGYTDVSRGPHEWVRDSKRLTSTISELTLVAAGATQTTEMLWHRPRRDE